MKKKFIGLAAVVNSWMEINRPFNHGVFMTDPHLPKASLALSSLGLIALAASLTLMAANSGQAAEILSPERQVHAEQGPSPGQQGDSAPPQGPGKKEGWNVTLGAGAIYKPAFVGSKDYQAMAFPDIKVEYGDVFFASVFEGIGYNVINTDTWRAGAIAKFDFGRAEDDDNFFRVAGDKTKALRGLGDVDETVELGGFLEYSLGSFSAMVELRQGVGGHEGLVGEVGLNYMGSIEQSGGEPIRYFLGPRATFADAKYNNAFFGIDQTQSSNSGLAEYDADAGLVSYGLGGFAMMAISEAISLGVFGGYDRLAGEAADSPLVTERGEENQFTSGVRVSYEFGL